MKNLYHIALFCASLFIVATKGCDTPGLDICHDGSSNVTCSSPDGGRWTYNDGTLIGTPNPNASSIAASDFVSCYCQLSSGFGTPIENHVIVTKCYGTDVFVGNVESTAPPTAQGFSNWFDGVTMMKSGFDPIDDATNYMNCRKDLTYTSQVTPYRGGELIYITWVQPEATFTSQLPSYAQSEPSGLCPGFDVQDGFKPNTDNSTITDPIPLQNAVDCTCKVSDSTLIGGTTASETINGNSFATICSNDFSVYWNGQGFRKARKSVTQGNDLISDQCNSRGASDTLLVSLKSTSDTTSSTSGGTTSSSSSTNTSGQQNSADGAINAISKATTLVITLSSLILGSMILMI